MRIIWYRYGGLDGTALLERICSCTWAAEDEDSQGGERERESSFFTQAKDSESGGLDVLPIRLCGRAEPPGDLSGFLASFE